MVVSSHNTPAFLDTCTDSPNLFNNYDSMNTIKPGGTNSITAVIPITEQIAAPLLFVRVKAVDKEGKYEYSKVLAIDGTCNIIKF